MSSPRVTGAGPGDRQIEEELARAFPGRTVAELRRRPYAYATSAPLDLVAVRFADGGEVDLVLKHLAWDRLKDDARSTRPRFLHRPEREIDTYRHLLAPAGIGPRLYGASRTESWLLVEKIDGVELWQVGDIAVWEAVARWLALFHMRFAGRVDQARAANPALLTIDRDWLSGWAERAVGALARSTDPRTTELVDALRDYGAVVDAVTSLPRTVIHGELYPSNVLVSRPTRAGDGDLRVCPVDWEMAAVGPAALDLAALVGGWDAEVRDRLLAAYRSELAATTPELRTISTEHLTADVDLCRLHLALQWIGWADGWQPPPEHARDWIGDALTLVR